MATIVKHVTFEAPADTVWAAVRAVGTAHIDLAPGFVVDSRPDGDDARLVTFVNGAVARELIVSVADDDRRLAYSVVDSPMGMTHHHAVMQILDEGDGGSRMVWTVDVLPHAATGVLDEMMEQGTLAMTRHLSAGGDRRQPAAPHQEL